MRNRTGHHAVANAHGLKMIKGTAFGEQMRQNVLRLHELHRAKIDNGTMSMAELAMMVTVVMISYVMIGSAFIGFTRREVGSALIVQGGGSSATVAGCSFTD